MLPPAYRINTRVSFHITSWRKWYLNIQLTLQARTFNSQPIPNAFALPFYLSQNSISPKCIGREEELTKMQEALRGAAQLRRIVVLQGYRGRGKTRLAIEYAQRHREDYSAIVWINARDELTINQSFARLAIWIINCDQSANYIFDAVQSKNQDQIVTAVKRWFDESANKSWLIIYDGYNRAGRSNVDLKNANNSLVLKENASNTDPKRPRTVAMRRSFDIRNYIPESDHGAVIVTTTQFLDTIRGDRISVGTFEAEDSLDLLVSSSCRENLRQGKLSYPSTYENRRLK
jgi:hypothetical protein